MPCGVWRRERYHRLVPGTSSSDVTVTGARRNCCLGRTAIDVNGKAVDAVRRCLPLNCDNMLSPEPPKSNIYDKRGILGEHPCFTELGDTPRIIAQRHEKCLAVRPSRAGGDWLCRRRH